MTEQVKLSRAERLKAQLEAEEAKQAELTAKRVARASQAKANAEPKLEHAKNRAAHWAAVVEELETKVKGYDAIIDGTSGADVSDDEADKPEGLTL